MGWDWPPRLGQSQGSDLPVCAWAELEDMGMSPQPGDKGRLSPQLTPANGGGRVEPGSTPSQIVPPASSRHPILSITCTSVTQPLP